MADKLIFFGNERLAGAVNETGIIFQTLLERGFVFSHLVINQSHTQSRKKHTDVVVELATKHGVEIISDWDKQRIVELASQSKAGILAAFGRIIPEEIIDAFECGIINIHPSLLPKYRGTTPIESAILNGDHKTGVSIMALAKGMDNGDIYAQYELDLDRTESKQELYEKLSNISAENLANILEDILDASLQPIEQDEDRATFTRMIEKHDGVIDWNKSATQIEREIRAYLGWPGSKTIIGSHEITVTAAHKADFSGTAGAYEVIEKQLIAYCHEGALVIDKLKPAGKSEMESRAFLAGYSI